jgi:hypothetical protein
MRAVLKDVTGPDRASHGWYGNAMPPWAPTPETAAKLDDAFQFASRLSDRSGYVTRSWVERLLAAEHARGVEEGRRQGQGRVISSTGTVG